jgi:hypothetical protein
MARLVGVVSKVVGQVYAVGDDGHRRLLVEGDRLFAGEQLETGMPVPWQCACKTVPNSRWAATAACR